MPRSGWLALGACIGALAASGVGVGDGRVAIVCIGAVAALLTGAPWLPATRRPAALALAIGMVALVVRASLGPAPANLSGEPGTTGPWPMVVESVGSPREGRQTATLRTEIDGPAGFRVAAALPRYPGIEPGDRVVVDGHARPRPDSPYGRYLERIGAWGTLDARSLELRDRPTDPVALLEGWRRDAGDALTRVLPEPEAGLAAGILIGLRDRVDRAVASAFTTAGVSHVVAISGWNIAIVAAGVTAVAGGLTRRRRSAVTALAIAAYIVAAGASPSVLRAGAMAGVVLLARESGRSGRASAALGWAVTLLLLADPRLIADAGFQLSSLATAGLIAWATPWSASLDRATRHRLPRWLIESLGVSLAAQAATLPIVLAAFGRLALVAPAVNLVVVPLVAPAMAAGLVALIGGGLVGIGAPGVVGTILAAPGWVALRLMIGIVEAAATLPFASVVLEPPVGVALGLASAIGAGVAMAWRRRSRPAGTSGGRAGAGDRKQHTAKAAIGRAPTRHVQLMRLATYALVASIGITGAVAANRPSTVARVTVLDVGQGDAILIEGSRGGRLLVDGGPDADRLLVALDERLPPWDRRIDVVVLSHPHEDHVAGLALLLARYRIGRVLEPGMRGRGPGYAAWIEALRPAGAPRRGSIAAGDRLTVDEVDLRVLWPIRGQVPAEPPDSGTGINNVSVVLLGTVGSRRFLLAGDVEEAIDPRLIGPDLPRIDLLKVAHHGSRTATTEAFIAATRPAVAVASAGRGNPYGHPARATLERLSAAGARVLRTDRDGSVTVAFEDRGLTVRTEPTRAAIAPPVVRAVARTSGSGPVRSFLCDVTAVQTPPPPIRRSFRAEPGSGAAVGYHRVDDGPWPGRRGCPALVARSPAVVPGAFTRRRRDRRLPRGADRGQRHRGRPLRRRGRRAAPRRRQDPASRRPGPNAAAWTGIGSLADEARPPGTGALGRGPPGDPPGRRR